MAEFVTRPADQLPEFVLEREPPVPVKSRFYARIKDYPSVTLARALDTSVDEVENTKKYAAQIGALDFIVDNDNVLFFRRVLGRGSFGRVYTASLNDESDVNYVVKEFRLKRKNAAATTTTLMTGSLAKYTVAGRHQQRPHTMRTGVRETFDYGIPSDDVRENVLGVGSLWDKMIDTFLLADDEDLFGVVEDDDNDAFAAKKASAGEFKLRYIEAEFIIGQTIERRLGGRFCAEQAVCAQSLLIVPELERGFLLFRYLPSIDLYDYTNGVLDQLFYRGESRGKLVGLPNYETMKRAYNSLLPGQLERTQLAGALRAYEVGQLFALNIALRVAITLDQLHGALIFHRDLKPENVIILDRSAHDDAATDGTPLPVEPLLIDFGLACAQKVAYDAEFDDTANSLTFCGSQSVGTPEYTDDFFRNTAFFAQLGIDAEERAERDGKMDVYALGRTMAIMFGADQDLPVYRTPSMPPGIFELISLMTGIDGERSQRQVARMSASERYRRFQLRPTAADVVRRLREIIANWSANTAIVGKER